MFLFTLLISACQDANLENEYDVLVLGEGTGAIAAAIQSARSGAETLLVNPQPWLGGMLTAAGVSATDGNHKLNAGLWHEWRSLIRNHYGGADSLFTGWVSNTMFEPKIGNQYWEYLAAKEENLTIYNSHSWSSISKENLWKVHIPKKNIDVYARILIDGTDLGDVAAEVGAAFDIGMDSRDDTSEAMAPLDANDILQDLTYVAILKDYGKSSDHTIDKPDTYDAHVYHCCCQHNCDDPKMHPCQTMLDYGKIPNNKYMINWPFHGNDFYANVIDMNAEQREAAYQEAKDHTLGFVYYIQTELGFKHLGLADDEFPTTDQLALMPYHREGRRIKGMVQLTTDHIQRPYDYTLYKTGIAVGDYPIDHHHAKNELAPDIDFPKVPSFSIPMGSIIPKEVDDFLIADKAMSVTNIANGSTRLQPVIVQVGQSAGLIAARSVKKNLPIKDLNIRDIQNDLLDANGYVLPFVDVTPDDSHFKAVQRVAASGILKGRPEPFKWANRTWFDPDSLLHVDTLKVGLIEFDDRFSTLELLGRYITQSQVQDIIHKFCTDFDLACKDDQVKIIPYNYPVTRKEFAEQLDLEIDLFELKDVNSLGEFID